MLPRTVFHGSSASCWNMYEARRLMPVSSSPNTSTRPPVGGVRPAMMFKSVDFPPPLGPTTETTVPAATSSVTPSTAVCAPNRLTTSRSDSAGVDARAMASFASPRGGKFVRVDSGGVDVGCSHFRVGNCDEFFHQLRGALRHQPVGRESLLHSLNGLENSLFAHAPGLRNHLANLLRRTIAYPTHSLLDGSRDPLRGVSVGPQPA